MRGINDGFHFTGEQNSVVNFRKDSKAKWADQDIYEQMPADELEEEVRRLLGRKPNEPLRVPVVEARVEVEEQEDDVEKERKERGEREAGKGALFELRRRPLGRDLRGACCERFARTDSVPGGAKNGGGPVVSSSWPAMVLVT